MHLESSCVKEVYRTVSQSNLCSLRISVFSIRLFFFKFKL